MEQNVQKLENINIIITSLTDKILNNSGSILRMNATNILFFKARIHDDN